MIAWLKLLPGKVWGWVIGVAIALGSLYLIYLSGRSKGTAVEKSKELEEVKQENSTVLKEITDGVKITKETHDEVLTRTDADLSKSADEWVRPAPKA